jgi:hypothetical protein
LNPYLFALVMDELTRHIQDILCCMLFADDIVIVHKTERGVNAKLEIWREALAAKKFSISMKCKFSSSQKNIYKVLLKSGVIKRRVFQVF